MWQKNKIYLILKWSPPYHQLPACLLSSGLCGSQPRRPLVFHDSGQAASDATRRLYLWRWIIMCINWICAVISVAYDSNVNWDYNFLLNQCGRNLQTKTTEHFAIKQCQDFSFSTGLKVHISFHFNNNLVQTTQYDNKYSCFLKFLIHQNGSKGQVELSQGSWHTIFF